MRNLALYAGILFSLFLVSCSSESKYEGPSPVDLLIRDMMDEESFSIILYDMQLDESKDLYQHKYRIKTNIDDSLPEPKVTEWKDVSEVFFAQNLENMGLELASKSTDGKIHKAPAPPGFNTAVGNPKYGEWRRDNSGNSFWAFYGQYAFMSSMFHMMAGRPVYRSTYTDYSRYRSNPSTSGRAYYGTGTKNSYGTSSATARATNPNFYQRAQQQRQLSSFQQKVKSNPSRYSRSSRTSRSSSRSGSSTRSRGGRYGK